MVSMCFNIMKQSEHAYLNSRYFYMSKLATPSSCGSKKVGSQTTLRQIFRFPDHSRPPQMSTFIQYYISFNACQQVFWCLLYLIGPHPQNIGHETSGLKSQWFMKGVPSDKINGSTSIAADKPSCIWKVICFSLENRFPRHSESTFSVFFSDRPRSS